ncbi:MAG: glutamate formimidoyltransferase [Anaerolineae bacterium]|nr:glutamate formimidoyltransferase [Anaerolineae bacterium]
MKPLIECVPNFSEGRDRHVVDQIVGAIRSVDGVAVLNVSPGDSANRTVVTFVGAPEPVIEAAFRAIKTATELIDMRQHHGTHPRLGATDVCPLVPLSGISMEETAAYAHKLARRVGEELGIPVYCYEAAATRPERKNLANIRAGEYEGLPNKLQDPEWQPDYGPAVFNPRAGATVVGAREFLVAYNVNLNTTSVRRANAVAFDVRERGRVKRRGNPLTGEIVRDANGEPVRIPGLLKGVKAIGWYVEEYGICQVSMNLTDLKATPLHVAFETVRERARARGMRVTGSKIIGMVPLAVLRAAGEYYLRQQQRSLGIPERAILHIAIRSLGLEEFGPFDPDERVVEYAVARIEGEVPQLPARTLADFIDDVASEAPVPGGGSVAAAVGALGAALGTMVANGSAHKRGWDERWEEFSDWAVRGRRCLETLIALVDQDTQAFQDLMAAYGLPKVTEEEQRARRQAIVRATHRAIEVPLKTMRAALQALDVLAAMAEHGNPNAVSDAGVGALCARTAVQGAYLNVQINAAGLADDPVAQEALAEGGRLLHDAQTREKKILAMVSQRMRNP